MKTADRLGYKAGELHTNIDLVTVNLCRLSGKRSTAGCLSSNTAYSEQVPLDTAPAPGDLCPIHPVRAQAVDENNLPPPSSQENPEFSLPPRALPVQPSSTPSNQPLRAQPVESEPPRATPVGESPPRAQPVD